MAILEKLTPVSRYSALRVVESADGTHWCHMHADLVDNPGRACFKPNLVNEIIQYQWLLADRMRRRRMQQDCGLQHVVLASDCDAFNLGGDLEYFCDSIRRQDRNALLTYARQCVRGPGGLCPVPWHGPRPSRHVVVNNGYSLCGAAFPF